MPREKGRTGGGHFTCHDKSSFNSRKKVNDPINVDIIATPQHECIQYTSLEGHNTDSPEYPCSAVPRSRLEIP